MSSGDTAQSVPEGTFAKLMSEDTGDAGPDKNERTNVATKKETLQRRNVGSKQRESSEDPGYLISVPATRRKIRATYDIFADQKDALSKLQLAAVDAGEKKPKLGDMLQEAIDNYVRKRARELGNVTVGREARS